MSAIRMPLALRAFVFALPLASCAAPPEPSPLLYPMTHVAYAGILVAKITSFEQGQGTIEINVSTGEVLQGQYTISLQGYPGFGSILAYGNGPRRCVSESGYTTDYLKCGLGEGVATLIGNRGTSMQCEFLNNSGGRGWGACRSSNGTTYRILY
jgi:hypothetical protein